jgi:hypothetical protein
MASFVRYPGLRVGGLQCRPCHGCRRSPDRHRRAPTELKGEGRSTVGIIGLLVVIILVILLLRLL